MIDDLESRLDDQMNKNELIQRVIKKKDELIFIQKNKVKEWEMSISESELVNIIENNQND